MKIIGITGGIGCGKSEVLRFLSECGAYVVEADRLAHRLMKKGMTAYKGIIECFGPDILDDYGEIDRERFGKLVFGDDKALKKLNSIVHPIVKDYILKDIDEKEKEGCTNYYVIEAALLIQDGYREICDEMWYIFAEKDVRLSRLIKGRGGDASKYMEVMSSQADESFYRDNCDVVIDNNDDFEKTQNVLKQLLNKSI